MQELTTTELFIIAPRPAEVIRQRSRAAEHRAAGVVRHPDEAKARAGAGAGGNAAPAR